ncbi:energy-coupling factor transporter ATP-binding protein EcfA2 [Sinorhizobium fredii]
MSWSQIQVGAARWKRCAGFKYSASGSRAVVLHSASFEIRGGCSTAIIGRSGAGTTTVVNLLIDGVRARSSTGSTLLNGGARSPWLARTWNSWTAPYYGQSATLAEVERAARLAERMASSKSCPKATRPSSAIGARACRPGSASASRLPGRSARSGNPYSRRGHERRRRSLGSGDRRDAQVTGRASHDKRHRPSQEHDFILRRRRGS